MSTNEFEIKYTPPPPLIAHSIKKYIWYWETNEFSKNYDRHSLNFAANTFVVPIRILPSAKWGMRETQRDRERERKRVVQGVRR